MSLLPHTQMMFLGSPTGGHDAFLLMTELTDLVNELSGLQQTAMSACEWTEEEKQSAWDNYEYKVLTFLQKITASLMGKNIADLTEKLKNIPRTILEKK